MKKLLTVLLFAPSLALATSDATTNMTLVGFVPEILEAKFVGNPPTLDMSPGTSTNNLLVGELSLTYNVPITHIKVKASTPSGMLENSQGKSGLQSFGMSLGGDGDKCHALPDAKTMSSTDLAGEGVSFDTQGLGDKAGYFDNCSVRISWKALEENKDPGRYTMDVSFTIVAQ